MSKKNRSALSDQMKARWNKEQARRDEREERVRKNPVLYGN